MEEEIWKDFYIENHGNIKVSNYGNVISATKKRLNKKVNSDGYFYYRFHYKGYRNLEKNNEKYMIQITVHRLVAFCFLENSKEFKEVNHIDGNKKNNFYKNLEWCTRSHNVKHCFQIGLRNSKGENNGRAKIKKEDVRKIKDMYSNKNSIAEIARTFKIGWTTVSHILKNESWKED